MNIGLGLLVEAAAFLAAVYVVVQLRPRLPRPTTDLVLGSIGCVMGAGALLFQSDVSSTCNRPYNHVVIEGKDEDAIGFSQEELKRIEH